VENTMDEITVELLDAEGNIIGVADKLSISVPLYNSTSLEWERIDVSLYGVKIDLFALDEDIEMSLL